MWQVNVLYNDGSEFKYAVYSEKEADGIAERLRQITIVSRVTIISPDR